MFVFRLEHSSSSPTDLRDLPYSPVSTLGFMEYSIIILGKNTVILVRPLKSKENSIHFYTHKKHIKLFIERNSKEEYIAWFVLIYLLVCTLMINPFSTSYLFTHAVFS